MAKHAGGRPTLYGPKIVDQICESIAQGKSLSTICKAKGLPSIATVLGWLTKHQEFLDRYMRAREQSADLLAEQILEISDDKKADPQRSRLQVEARKWIAAKLKPKKYGDHIRQEVTADISLRQALDGIVIPPTAPIVDT